MGLEFIAQGQGLRHGFGGIDSTQECLKIIPGADFVLQLSLCQRGIIVAASARLPGFNKLQQPFTEIVEDAVEGLQVINTYGLHMFTKHGFHRQFPAIFHAQVINQTFIAAQMVALQPLLCFFFTTECRLLQGIQRSLTPQLTLQFTALF